MNSMIRHLQLHDIARVHALFLRLLDEGFAEFPEQARRHYILQWQPSVLASACAEPQRAMLVAYADNGEPQGYLFGTGVEGGVATIVWLATAPEFRQKGVGKSLLTAACVHYQQQNAHKLRLFTHSEAALQFYIRAGWQCEGKHPLHWWQMTFWSLGLHLDGKR